MQNIEDKTLRFKSTVFTSIKLNCSGCSACSQICPKHAIKMTADEEGFLFPKLDSDKCVQCGLCDKICPELNNHQANSDEYKQCFVATNVDDDYSRTSATIGACTMMAEYILSKGGYVFGVIMDEREWKAKHVFIDNNSLLQKTRNSKYIQSDPGDTFTNVKELLCQDKIVLYIGTPCQIAGLKSFLRKDYDKLYTIDLICHGVYSYKLLRKEIEYLTEKYCGKIKNFKFRSKEKYPWSYGGVINFDVENTKGVRHIEIHGSCSPLYRSYAYSGDGINYTLRESCYACKFREINRYGDVTIGDAWGISKFNPTLFQNKKYIKNGISLIICNTHRGRSLLRNIECHVNLIEIPIKQAFSQDALNNTNRLISPKRYQIYNNIDKENWKSLIEKVLGVNFQNLVFKYHFYEFIKLTKTIVKKVIFYNRWKR